MKPPGQERISTRQVACLVFYMIVGDMLFVLPPLTAAKSGSAAWLSALIAVPAAPLIMWLLLVVSRLHPELRLSGLAEKVLGKWPGRIVSGGYAVYFVLGGATYARETVDFLSTEILTDTPIRVLDILGLLAIAYVLRKGLEPLARSGEIFFGIFIAVLVVVIILTIPNFTWTNLQPVTGNGALSIVKGGIYNALFPWTELCPLLVLMPYVKRRKHTGRDLLLTSLLGSFLMVGIIAACLLVLGEGLCRTLLYPAYVLAQSIDIGHFLQRIEVMLAINWLFGICFKATLYQFAFLEMLAGMTRMKDKKPLIYPGILLMFGLTYLISPNMLYYAFYITDYYLMWDITFGILLPLLILAVALVRRKRAAA
ncbi:GerAB/ArcD/ProY family transporter [Paenibacillus spiritus]|uniref:GerAB/ArcD/ProY family transporter n=1 Tax=Paenibacillus spiritus TaxID=2496557 RepID=A0A5J5GC84_9BACL|nr:endospore germination permease [Paenibacillus spiritus]KAA9005412.1 GerAB/ArcD/ProY family transporter [Paenibacillus spiritus]